MIRSLPLAHPSGFVYVARFPSAPFPPGTVCIAKVPLMLENQNELRTPATGNTSKDFHVYEVRPRKDERGVDLISDALPFGRLWYGEP